MAMQEHGEVTSGEGCLRMRDRVERDTGIDEDFLAVRSRDLDMLGQPFALQPLAPHSRSSRTDLVRGF
jgi:hypothetical protein